MREMRGIEWEWGNQCGYTGNVGGNAEDAQNQCNDAENQGGNLGIAVEMT